MAKPVKTVTTFDLTKVGVMDVVQKRVGQTVYRGVVLVATKELLTCHGSVFVVNTATSKREFSQNTEFTIVPEDNFVMFVASEAV
jgi:hypothetical protein